MKIKLIVVQLEAVAGDIQANINKIEALISEQNKSDIDLIVLPELWTTGWDCTNFNKYSENLYSSQTYNFLKELSKKYASIGSESYKDAIGDGWHDNFA